MSTDQLSPRRASQPQRGDAKLVEYDEYINRQVESTRRVVKIVDLATSLVVLAAGILAFLLAVAVVEHWLVPGGFSVAARTGLFAILAGGVGYFAFRRLWPLVIRKINPVYAAQAIEQTGPSLKNSLINLLLFRQKRSEISDAVYHTLEEQAAQRLSRVPLDAAVDRSLLIRFGYVLVAIVAVAALYKVFSPKDPVVAARRVLLPWADIVPASRVSISGIEPGSVTVSRGEFINVSAEVRGIDDNDSVVLRFTTSDGQAVEKPVPMKLSGDGLRFEGRLPDKQDGTGEIGVAQNLTYRIEAGDARSLDYAVTVVPSPSILVERIEYDYPQYTGYVDRHVDAVGDIRAIEGTRVTIHARANGPIDKAHVDFDADGRLDMPMTAHDTGANASFELALRDDRQTPEHASYVLRFTNDERRSNRNPVKHSIVVEPDYAPEAAILVPREMSREVRLDETVTIEVQARDPDFALADVRLRGEVAGRAAMDERLLAGEHTGRFTARYQFTPSAYELRAGDVVQYWATANDNRTPKPNTAASEKKLFRIVSPDPAEQPPPDRVAQRDPRRQQKPQDPQPQPGEQQQPGEAGGEGQPGENQQPQDGQGDGQQGQGQPVGGDAQRSADERDAQPGADGGSASQSEGEDAAARKDDPSQTRDDAGQPDGQGGQSEQQARPGERDSNDKQTGAGAAGGEPSQGAQPDGARPDSDTGARPKNGGQQNGNQQPSPDAEPMPVSSEGDNDAEAFERIQRHLERSGELKDGDSTAPEADVSRQGDKETPTDGETGDDGAPDERGEGSGAETTGDDPKSPEEQPGDKKEQSKSPGGQETSTKGPSGAGDEQQSQGAPNSQPEMKPAEKRQQSPSQGEQSNDEEPPADTRGKRESDSQGEEGGDRSGGGEEGGGQKAPREGTGSAGQNQSADEGAGESAEQGTGTDSPDAGQDAVTDKPTGEPGGETAGRGTKQREGEGNQPGGEAGVEDDPARSAQGEDDPAREDPDSQQFSRDAKRSADESGADRESDSADDKPNANRRGTATGDGGQEGTDTNPPPRVDGTVPDGDEANLQYARKQTDLVLEKLAEQLNRKRVDEDLLDRLGWSEDDLRKFVERWQQRKQAAERSDQSGEAARRELDEALQSLGLRRGPMQQGPVKEDTIRDLREGYRGPVPLEYQERLRAYNQGVSRARQDGE